MEIDTVCDTIEFKEDKSEIFSYSAYDNVCDICAAEFIDDEELSHHILHVHQPESSLTRYCTLCRTLLPSIEDYARHILNEHIWDLQTCEFCCRVFNDADKLQLHIVKHQRAKELGQFVCSCSQCPLQFSSIDDLISHEGMNHENHEGIMLLHCLPHLSSILHMKAQTFLRSLGQKNVYSCIKCNFTTIKPTIYLKHLQVNHTMCIVCYECATPFRNLKRLTYHLKVKRKNNNATKKCRFCKTYFDKGSILSHEIMCKDTFKCELCDVIMCSVAELTNHQVKEHPAVVSIVVCNYCGKNCPGQEYYMLHIERVHKPQLHLYKYTCKKCDLFYKHPKKLFGHYYTAHKDLEPYSCKICDKKFRIRKHFTIHIKTVHTSYGFIRFDDNFHVYFCNNRSNTVLDDHDYVFQNESIGKAKNANSDELSEKMDTYIESTKGKPSNNEVKVKINKPHIKKIKRSTNTESENINKEITHSEVSIENVQNKNLEMYNVIGNNENKLDDVSANVNNNKVTNEGKVISQSLVEDLITSSSSDDDIPLNDLKKKQSICNKTLLKNKYKLKHYTCRECNKKCYTFNNYNNHINTHTSKSMKQCDKCGMVFKKTYELNYHKTSMHNKSELTQTLKKIIERRNQEKEIHSKQYKSSLPRSHNLTKPYFDVNESEFINSKIKLAIKKVNFNNSSLQSKATLRDISLYNTNSVKTYLESFKSETDKKQYNDSVKIRKTMCNKVPVIQLTQVKLEPSIEFTKLSMPVKFRECYKDYHKAKLQVFLDKTNVESKLNFGLTDQYPQISIDDYNYFNDEYNDNISNDDECIYDRNRSLYNENVIDYTTIPDVGQEVFVEEPQMQKVREIILPECAAKSKDIKEVSIAYLLNKAPFYKVVKVKTLLKKPKLPKHKKTVVDKNFKVPENIKLVNVNPLEHLLKGKTIENIEYEEKIKAKEDYKKLLAKALLDLESQETAERKKNTKKKESVKELLIEE